MPQDSPDHPQVRLPAPIIMLLFLALGAGLNWLWPMQLEAELVRNLVGWSYNALGLGLIFYCFFMFHRRRTSFIPTQPVQEMVVSGPYRYTRNPMYVGLALVHLGIGIATGNIWIIATFAPSMLAIRLWVIAPEETYMQHRFGAAYSEYRLRVPRWF